MATYNPFEDFNPMFTIYEPANNTGVVKNYPIYGDISIPNASSILSDGTIIFSRNIPKKEEENTSEELSSIQPMKWETTKVELENMLDKSDKISLKGSEHLSKIIDEVSNEKNFEKLKDPHIKKLILLQAKRESTFNPTVQNKQSSACGYFQFIDSTRKRYSNYSKADFLKDQKEQVRAAYKHLVDIHNTPSALKLKQRGYNDALITALGWWYPRSMDMVLQGKKDFSLGGYSIKQAFKDYG